MITPRDPRSTSRLTRGPGPLLVSVSIPAWYEDALCAQIDLDGFFPELGHQDQAQRAAKICTTCPVQKKCLEYAVVNKERYGVWGGTTWTQRNKLIKERAS